MFVSLRFVSVKEPTNRFPMTLHFALRREVFFVPYVWDVIVCTVTTTTMEWSRSEIRVFPLNNIEEDDPPLQNNTSPIGLVTDADQNSIDISDADMEAYGNTADVV